MVFFMLLWSFFKSNSPSKKMLEDFTMLEELSRIISNEQNENLNRILSKEKVKATIMGLNTQSVEEPME